MEKLIFLSMTDIIIFGAYCCMINKNIHPSFLNTISISYRPQQPFSAPSSSQQPEQPETKNYNQPLSQSTPTRSKLSPPQQAFSDLKFKNCKSQTLKESSFNRLRVNIYRRDKKSKWQELYQQLQKKERLLSTPPLIQKPKEVEQIIAQRQNKTSFHRRRYNDAPSDKARYRTHSSEKEELLVSEKKKLEEQKQTKFQQSVSLKLTNFINNTKMNGNSQSAKIKSFQKQLDKADIILNHNRIRNFSDQIYHNKFKKHKFEVRRLNSPKKNKDQQEKTAMGKFQKNQQIYQAWESVDIFSSNKNGIIEYAREIAKSPINTFEICEGSGNEEEERVVERRRRRFLHRD